MNKLNLRLNARYRVIVLRPDKAVALLDEVQSLVIEDPIASVILSKMQVSIWFAELMAEKGWKLEGVVAVVNHLIGRGIIEFYEDENDSSSP